MSELKRLSLEETIIKLSGNIAELMAEVRELRAWKAQRLKEETKSWFKSLEENGQLGELIDELNKLRAWKTKARPFLQAELENLSACFAMREPFEENTYISSEGEFLTRELHADLEKEMEEQHATLTELLKEAE